jgi:hypothetical protein
MTAVGFVVIGAVMKPKELREGKIRSVLFVAFKMLEQIGHLAQFSHQVMTCCELKDKKPDNKMLHAANVSTSR